MRSFGSPRIAVVLFGLCVAARGSAQSVQPPPTLAVLPFENGAPVSDARLAPLGRGIADLLTSELAKDQRIRVVERVDLDAVLAEQGLRSLVAMDDSTAVRAGRLLGARHLMTGTYLADDSTLTIAVKVLESETGRVLWSHREQGASNEFVSLLTGLARVVAAQFDLPAISAQLEMERSRRKIPFQAVMLYSRAINAEDSGNRALALDFLQQATTRFPEFEDANRLLQKLRTSPMRPQNP